MNELNRNEMNVSTIELLMEAGLTPEEIMARIMVQQMEEQGAFEEE